MPLRGEVRPLCRSTSGRDGPADAQREQRVEPRVEGAGGGCGERRRLHKTTALRGIEGY